MQGIGEFSIPRVITQPSDIDALKTRVDPDFRATNATAHGSFCNLPPEERKAWDDFYKSWRTYCDTPTNQQIFQFDWTGLFNVGAGGVYEEGQQYESRLHDWQQKLAAEGCQGNAPWLDDPKKRGADLSWVKWVAGAVAVAGIVYTAGPFLRAASSRVAKTISK